jgi:hypothetical protein
MMTIYGGRYLPPHRQPWHEIKRNYYLEPKNDNPKRQGEPIWRARKSLRSPDNATIRDVADLSDTNALADAKGYFTYPRIIDPSLSARQNTALTRML